MSPIVPGKPDESELVQPDLRRGRERADAAAAAKLPLSEHDKQVLKQWIADGAEYKTHWAFLPPARPAMPVVSDRELAAQPDRRVRPGPARGGGAAAVARGRPGHADPAPLPRPDRPAADARGGRCVRPGRFPGRLREAGRPAARLAPLRRALGPALARPGPLRRHQRLREGPRALDLAVSRLGDPGPQRRHAVRPVHRRAARRRPAARTPRSTSGSPPASTATRCSTRKGASTRWNSASTP